MFSEAAIGLIALIGESSSEQLRMAQVHIEAPDLDALFVDWLSEVLFYFEAQDLVVERADVMVSSKPWRLDGTLMGRATDAFEATGAAVKAITYRGLAIKENDTGFEAYVYVDV